ncbi:hypothetical protein [Saccharopolyspora erythraea]|uniref:hypothetical protein n=1 Tax=Saccharopolyspora erythraea TaxID=1836 RepID=UPI002011AA04|nr:hypothetical protein [Saccharopolyspora erythraea]
MPRSATTLIAARAMRSRLAGSFGRAAGRAVEARPDRSVVDRPAPLARDAPAPERDGAERGGAERAEREGPGPVDVDRAEPPETD